MGTSDESVVELLRQARRIAALTGAGISTAAGIPDFRGPRGLYVTRQYDPEKTFDIGYFDRDPTYFFAFARDFVRLVEQVKPTRSRSARQRPERTLPRLRQSVRV